MNGDTEDTEIHCVTVWIYLTDGSERSLVTEVALPRGEKVKNAKTMITRGKNPLPFPNKENP